jgi:hypothetical protein
MEGILHIPPAPQQLKLEASLGYCAKPAVKRGQVVCMVLEVKVRRMVPAAELQPPTTQRRSSALGALYDLGWMPELSAIRPHLPTQ